MAKVKGLLVSNEELKSAVQDILTKNEDFGSQRVVKALELSHPSWKIPQWRVRQVLRDVRSKSVPAEMSSSNDNPSSEEANKRRGKNTNSKVNGKGKGKSSGKGGQNLREESGGGGGGGGGGGDANNVNQLGGQFIDAASDKIKAQSKLVASKSNCNGKKPQIDNINSAYLSGLTAVESGGIFPNDVVSKIKRNGKTQNGNNRWLGTVEKVGGLFNEDEYYDDDDEEELKAGMVQVNWCYPKVESESVSASDLLILDRIFSTGDAVTLASDPVSSLGYVMDVVTTYDVQAVKPKSPLVRDVPSTAIKPTEKYLDTTWVRHKGSNWLGEVKETVMLVYIRTEGRNSVDLEFRINTEDFDENRPLREGGHFNFPDLYTLTNFEGQHVVVEKGEEARLLRKGELDAILRRRNENDMSQESAEQINKDVKDNNGKKKKNKGKNATSMHKGTIDEDDEESFKRECARRIKASKGNGVVMATIMSDVRVSWRVCPVEAEDVASENNCSLIESISRSGHSPPPEWCSVDELQPLNEPETAWDMFDVVTVHDQIMQVMLTHTKATIHWADGSISTDKIDTLKLAPKMVLNEHHVMVYDAVAKTNALSINKTQAEEAGLMGIVTKADNVNCVVNVHWLKTNRVETLPSYDIQTVQFNRLAELVIRRLPTTHRIICTQGAGDEEEEVDDDKLLSEFTSVAYLDECYKPHFVGTSSTSLEKLPQQIKSLIESYQNDGNEFQDEFIRLTKEDCEIARATTLSLASTPARPETASDVSSLVGFVTELNFNNPSNILVSWMDGTTNWVDLTEVFFVRSLFDMEEEESEYGTDYGDSECDYPFARTDNDDEEDGSDCYETESENGYNGHNEGKGVEIGDVGDMNVRNNEDEEEEEEEKKQDEGSVVVGAPNCEEDEEDDDSFFCALSTAPLDHHFIADVQTVAAQVVHKQFTILRRGLPASSSSSSLEMVVRCFEDRMDLLRVMIIGPKDTPYELVPFFFDIQLPNTFPDAPPKVHYISTASERLNPNLYEDGKVCLSLLGTWSGPSWCPGQSTLLQVLLSIQALILVDQPFFNEPGYEKQANSEEGAENSCRYNEKAKLLSLRSACMLSGSPPQYFHRHLQTHFKQSGPKMVEKVKEICKKLNQNQITKITMAEIAAKEVVETASIREKKRTIKKNEIENGKAAEEDEERPNTSVFKEKHPLEPSIGFLLSLQKMIPTLEKLFE